MQGSSKRQFDELQASSKRQIDGMAVQLNEMQESSKRQFAAINDQLILLNNKFTHQAALQMSFFESTKGDIDQLRSSQATIRSSVDELDARIANCYLGSITRHGGFRGWKSRMGRRLGE